MYELPQQDYALVRSLFAPIPHSRSIVFSVIEGHNPGRIFVDRPAEPRSAFLASVTGFFYLCGAVENEPFHGQVRELILDELCRDQSFVFLVGLSEPWSLLIDVTWGDRGGGWAERYEFAFPWESWRAWEGWRARVPENMQVVSYDQERAAAIPELAEFWDGVDRFLARGFGFALVKEDQAVSHCHTVVLGDGLAEISVETVEAYRGQGLATLACCAFIEHCRAVGLQPHWSCWHNNTPSSVLAQKLGFVRTPDVRVRYIPLNV